MKTRINLCCIFFLLSGLVGMTVQAQQTITFENLLEEMTDYTVHCQWPQHSYICKQASSYSRDSKTNKTAQTDGDYKPQKGRDWGKGWFKNNDFGYYIRTEQHDGRTEKVMMDAQGPGAIVRFWAAYGGWVEGGGIYRIYVDNQDEPVIAMKNTDLIGSNGLVPSPFSFCAPAKTENSTWCGHNLILPIPYNKGCKVTFEATVPKEEQVGWEGHYYQINYRSYTKETSVKSFDKHTLDIYQKGYLNNGKDGRIYCYSPNRKNKYENRLYETEVKLISKPMMLDDKMMTLKGAISAGDSLQFNLGGEQAITRILLKIDAPDIEQALRSTVLKITFDDEETVWCPVGQFFGIGYRPLINNTFYVSTQSDGLMAAYWKMPFSKRARVQLVNCGHQKVDILYFGVNYKPVDWMANKSMYFHATWNESYHLDTSKRIDYNYITIKGKGVYVGDNLTIYNYCPLMDGSNWWGEGDEKIYVDNEDFPSHFGTGSEDYYSYAWCRPQCFSFPNISQPSGQGNKTTGLSVNNRYRLLDAIPFTKAFRFDMEIWHPYQDKVNYSPATFWYAMPGATWNYHEDLQGVQRIVEKGRS